MADARHRFVPTEQSTTSPRTAGRRAVSRPLLRTGTAWALVLGAALLIGRPFFAPSGAGDLSVRFADHRNQFQLLKDMLLAEPSVTSVGVDNVREYWLFDGRWSSPRRPGKFFSRADMLESVALSPARYEAYLDLLKAVGGYRAAQSGTGGARRITVHLFPSAKGGNETARMVYAPAGAAAPKRASPLGDGWFLETDKR